MMTDRMLMTGRGLLGGLVMLTFVTAVPVTSAADWFEALEDEEHFYEREYDRINDMTTAPEDDRLINDAVSFHPERSPAREGEGPRSEERRRRHCRHHHHRNDHRKACDDHRDGPWRDESRRIRDHHHGRHVLLRRLERLEHKLDLVLRELREDNGYGCRRPESTRRRRGRERCPYCKSKTGRTDWSPALQGQCWDHSWKEGQVEEPRRRHRRHEHRDDDGRDQRRRHRRHHAEWDDPPDHRHADSESKHNRQSW